MMDDALDNRPAGLKRGGCPIPGCDKLFAPGYGHGGIDAHVVRHHGQMFPGNSKQEIYAAFKQAYPQDTWPFVEGTGTPSIQAPPRLAAQRGAGVLPEQAASMSPPTTVEYVVAPADVRPLHRLPSVVAHADWSTDQRKRWVAIAELTANGTYKVVCVVPVGDVKAFFPALLSRGEGPASVFAGFDFPIGVPRHYARLAGIQDLTDWLPQLGTGRWKDFFAVAERSDEIGVYRPFYPMAPGDKSQAHLTTALEASSMDALLRQCDRRTETRRQACSIFWTLGGNQVGKAAIAGWRDLLLPALASSTYDVRLWPFDGKLFDLFGAGHVVVAETYPAEYYHHLGLDLGQVAAGMPSGKRRYAARQANAARLLAWCEAHGIQLAPEVCDLVEAGFGPDDRGEDPFDALVGLLGMLEVLWAGKDPDLGVPAEVARIEGWILGQAAGAVAPCKVAL